MPERSIQPVRGRNDFHFYEAPDGQVRIIVRTDGETVWLEVERIAELFARPKAVISRHLKNIFKEGELDADQVTSWFRVDEEGGSSRRALHYDMAAILAVGYRVKSDRGMQLRRWATDRLRGYLVKGFAVNEEVLEEPGTRAHFNELVMRVRQAEAVRRGLPKLF